MARFFGRPSINDHLDDLIGSWFGKALTPPVKDHGSKPPPQDDGQGGQSSRPDHTPPHPDDGPDFPPVKDVIKFWLHKVFGGHHNPPPDGNDAPVIVHADQTGQIPEGDSTDALKVTGAIKFIDKDFGDTHTATVEFVSTTDPSGMEYGGLEAEVNPNIAGGVIATALPGGGFCRSQLQGVEWTYTVNDADIQQLAEGEQVVQTYRVTVTDAAGEQDSRLISIRLQGHNDEPIAAAVALEVGANATTEIQAASLDTGPLAVAAFAADDVDNDDNQATLTYEILGQPSGGTIINNNDGTFSFDPGHDFDDLAAGETRDVTVSYRAIDSHGAASNEATITITVRGVGSSTPQPPVVEDQSFAVPEESEAGHAVGTVLATDPDSTTLSYAIVDGNDAGLFAIDAATGAIRLAQGVDDPQVGNYALRVAVSDGDNTATATVTVEVTPVNDAPVAADGAATTDQDKALTGALPAAADAENDPVAYGVGTQALNGTVLIATDGSYSYTPNAGFSGTDSFTYVVDDGNGGTNEYHFVVTVTPVVLPEARPDTNVADAVVEAGVDEATGAPVGDATATGNALDNDTGQGVSVVGVVAGVATGAQTGGVGTEIDGTFGTLTLGADGQWMYALDDWRAATDALAPGQVAHDVFSYTIADEHGATSTTTLIVAITGSADPAAAVPPRAVADINVDDAVVEAGTTPDGTPIPGDATAQGNALANDEGHDLAVVGVAAGPLGAAPGVGVGDTIRGTYGTLVLGSDGHWDYTLDDANPATEALGQGQQATDVFSYTIEDPSGQTSTAQVFVVISGSNDEVVVVNTPPTANPDTNVSDPVIEAGLDLMSGDQTGDPEAMGNVLANDTDPDIATGDMLTVVGVAFGATTEEQSGNVGDQINGTYGWLTLNDDGTWQYVLDDSRIATEALRAGQQATEVFTYTVADTSGAHSTTTLSVVVNGSDDAVDNQPPAVRAPLEDQTTAEEAQFSFQVRADAFADPEGGALAYTATLANGDPLPTWLQFDAATQTFSGTPDDPDIGQIAVVVRATDPAGDFATQTFNITVTPVNDAPVANDDPVTVAAGTTTSIDVLANDTDVEGDTLQVTGVGAAMSGTAEFADVDGDGKPETVQYTPNAGFTGTDAFTYTISDGNGGTATATVNVTVARPENAAPVANDDPTSLNENTVLSIALDDLTANDTDPDGDPLTVTAINGVSLDDVALGGVIALGSGVNLVRTGEAAFTYNPSEAFDSLNPGETATDQFTYTISDGHGHESTASVNITINGENDDPVAVADTATAASPGPQTLIYFAATGNFLDTGGGRELYAFNPATGALKLVADVNDVDLRGSDPQSLTPLDGKLYFVAHGNTAAGDVGYELFVFNPATNETKLVADLFDGSDDSFPTDLTVIDGKLYFQAEGTDTGTELYVLDPATDKATLVDINPGADSSYPDQFTGLDGKVYFFADDGVTGQELRVLDPSTGEVSLVADLNEGPGGAEASGLMEINGKLYFAAHDNTAAGGDFGVELFVYDPSSGLPPARLTDLNPDAGSSYPDGFTELNGNIYFTANNPDTGRGLYVYDPASGMTAPVPEASPGVPLSFPDQLTVLDGQLYFVAEATDPDTGDSAAELYAYDPATGMTTLIPGPSEAPGGSSPDDLTVLDGRIFFIADGNNAADGDVGRELYAYDPATGDVTLIADLNLGNSDASTRLALVDAAMSAGSSASELTVVDGKLYFSAIGNNTVDGNVGRELYVYDPATDTTTLAADVDTDPVIPRFKEVTTAVIGTNIYFVSPGDNATDGNVGVEPYVLDTLTGEAKPLIDLVPGPGSSNPTQFTVIDDKLYFAAAVTSGYELYVHDPATGTTTLVTDPLANARGSNPEDIVGAGGKVYFTAEATDGTDALGRELYVYDPASGSPATLVADLNLGADGSFPSDLTVIGGKLYFTAQYNDGTASAGNELFVLDPNDDTPVLIDVNPGANSSNPSQLTEFDGKIYFVANGVNDTGDAAGNEVYVLDPATNQATLVADLDLGAGSSYPAQLTVVDGKLYFTATGNDATPDGNVGRELYVIDPAAGPAPTLVADLNPGEADSMPSSLTALGDKLYFSATGPQGNELYVIDPAVGPDPVLVADLSASGGSYPGELMVLDGRLYFTAEGDDGTDSTGLELYVVDPATGQVDLVPEAYAGAGSSNPDQITAFNGKIYFSADGNNLTDGVVGRELYVYDPVAKTTTLVADLNIAEASSGGKDQIAAEAAIGPANTAGSSNPTALTVVDGKLYFTASAYNETDGLVGQAIYVIDPAVSDKPVLVADVDALTTADSTPRYLTELTADGLPEASGNVLDNDTDVDNGDTLTVVGVQAGALSDPISGNVGTEIDGRYGTLVLNTDGSWTYVQDFGAPSTGNPGDDVFSYTLRDASGATSTTTLTIAVVPGTDENRAPVATGEATDISQDDVLTFKLSDLLANDRDPNGDTLAVTMLGKIDLADFPPGSVLNDDGGVTLTRIDADTFTLDLNGTLDKLGEGQSQTGHLQYTISDGEGGTATAVFDVTVHGVNDAPVAVADTASAIPFIYFSAQSTTLDGTSGRQLYAYDRSTGTTTLVADVNDIDRGGSSPESITDLAGKVYFVAYGNNQTDGVVGQELYVFTPTTGETRLVADLSAGSADSSPTELTVLDGKLYFVAEGNNGVDGDVGQELYVLDPTTDTATLVADLNPGPDGASISGLTPLNGLLYFAASDDINGSELRVLDPATGQISVAADVNPSGDSNPSDLTVLDGNLYFTADGASGRELYVLDPASPEEARLVADVNMGSSYPQDLTLVDGKIYFTAVGSNDTDGDVGRELYVYDPADGTTILAADIISGPEGSTPRELTALGGQLYFVADTYDANDNYVTELFVYDPTSGKAIEIPSSSTQPDGSSPDELTVLDGKLYFTADGTNMAGDDVGRELYVYDPLTQATTLIADLNQGADSGMVKLMDLAGGSTGGSSNPAGLTVIDGKLYFSAEGNNQTDGAIGREPYVYDPTTGIVSLVADVDTDPASVRGVKSGSGLAVIDGNIYFSADGVNPTDGNIGQELYVIDTATDTATPVADLATGPASSLPAELTVIDGKLYFSADGSNATDGNVGRELYVYDPASGEATLIADLAAGEDDSNPSSITALAGKVYFVAYGNNNIDGEVGEELYVHDPATGATTLVADVFAGVGSSFPDQLTVVGGKLYFVATGNDGMNAIGRELYVLDPTTDTASPVADLNEGSGSSYPDFLTVIDGKLYFVAEANNTTDGNVGGELYVLDPTSGVPTLVADLYEGAGGSYPHNFTELDGKIYFVAYGSNMTDGNVGEELYVYDPAGGSGATLVSDLYAGAGGSNADELTVLDGKLYFAANGTNGMGGDIGRELYVIDPAAGGVPTVVADLSSDPGGSAPQDLTVLDGKLYFTATGDNATDGDVGRELYVYDPATGKTTLLPEAYTGSGSSDPSELTVLDGKLYFAATGDNATDGNVGEELYSYDPATGKTSLVADLNTLIVASGGSAEAAALAMIGDPAAGTSSLPSGLTVVDGKLYFTAFGANEVDGTVGREAYVYDPATGQTSLVADLSTRTAGSDPAGFTPAGGGTTLNGNVLSNDTDVDNGDTFAVVGVQAGGSSDPVSGNLDTKIEGLYGTLVLHADGGWTYNQDLGAPQPSDPQIDVFTYTIADAAGLTSTTTLSITAQPAADGPPVAGDDAITVSENDLLTISLSDLLANDSDPDGDALSVTNVGGLDLATFPPGSILTTHGLTYARPDADTITLDFAGQFDALGQNEAQVTEVPYVISDGRGGTATGTLTLTINGVNDAPVAADDAATVPTGASSTSIDVLGNDSDVDENDQLQVVGVAAAMNGTTTLVDKDGDGVYERVAYAPNAGFTGTDAFTYDISDGHGGTATATVTVNVGGDQAPVVGGIDGAPLAYTENDPATAVASGIMVNDDGDLVGATIAISGYIQGEDFLALASPPTGISAVFDDQSGVLTLSGTATPAEYEQALQAVTYQNTSDDPITVARTLTFSVDDGVNVSDPVSRDVAVTAVNDAPVAGDDAAVTTSGVAVDIDVLANDSDAESDGLSITTTTAPANGTVDIVDTNHDGIADLSYQPVPGFSGTDSFDYAIDDGHGGTDTGTVTVVVAQEVASAPGTETLDGHIGPDRFVYHLGDGPVTIANFEPGPQGEGQIIDQIEISGFPGLDFNTLDSNKDGVLDPMDGAITGDQSGITLHLGTDDALTVANVTALAPDDLLFS